MVREKIWHNFSQILCNDHRTQRLRARIKSNVVTVDRKKLGAHGPRVVVLTIVEQETYTIMEKIQFFKIFFQTKNKMLLYLKQFADFGKKKIIVILKFMLCINYLSILHCLRGIVKILQIYFYFV